MAFSKLFSKLSLSKATPSLPSDDLKVKAKLVLHVPVFDNQIARKAIEAVDKLYVTRKPEVVLTVTKNSIYVTQCDKTGDSEVIVDIPHCCFCEITVTKRRHLLAIKYQEVLGPLSIAFLKIKSKRRFFRKRTPKINSKSIKNLINKLRTECQEETKKDQLVRSSQDTSFYTYPVGFETTGPGSSFNDSTFYEVTLDMDCSMTSFQECGAEHFSEHTSDIGSTNSKVDHSDCDCVSESSCNFYSDQSFCTFDIDSDSLQSFDSASTLIASDCNNPNNVSSSDLTIESSHDSPLNDSLESHWDFDQFDDFLHSLYGTESDVSTLERSDNKMQQDSFSEEDCSYTLDELIDSILRD